ncbi:MAG: DNA primase, partial [Nitrososphaera sp.]
TGAVSGLVVLDVDGNDDVGRPFPDTPTARTRSGHHWYFAHPGGQVPNAVRLLPGLDVRGDGGYVVAPPSEHPSGQRYTWVEGRSPWNLPPAPLPDWLRELLSDRAAPDIPRG